MVLAAVPPQVCVLALGVNGLSLLLLQWGRITATNLHPFPFMCSLTAFLLVAFYSSNIFRDPKAVISDLSNPAALPGLSAGVATSSALVARFGPVVLSGLGVQAGLFTCYVLALAVSLRFLQMCYRVGQWPDPSWFPAVLLALMNYLQSQASGPALLKAPGQFAFFTGIMLPLLAVVAYRMCLSKARHSVAPHAGMALLMAPASFFCTVYLATGKPYGDKLGSFLFACSTIFFLLTLRLLYVRRALWIGGFHLTYVAFTFPSASTATAALLASEKLPEVAGLGALSRAWAGVLSVASVTVIMAVFVRMFVMLSAKILEPAAPSDWPGAYSQAKISKEGKENSQAKIHKEGKENKLTHVASADGTADHSKRD